MSNTDRATHHSPFMRITDGHVTLDADAVRKAVASARDDGRRDEQERCANLIEEQGTWLPAVDGVDITGAQAKIIAGHFAAMLRKPTER